LQRKERGGINTTINKIAVLGAGTMGVGIAQAAARAGMQVILRDLQKSLVRDGLRNIENDLGHEVSQGQISAEEKDMILSRIEGTTDLAQLHDVNLVNEAVVENMAVKKQLFAELDNICSKNTILATNTSSLSITEIASATKRQDKVLGMHFFKPVTTVKLVELIKGIETSDSTIDISKDFADRIGKTSVVVNRENPGFIVNRILVPYINEAIFAYAEGLAGKEEIDTAMKLGAGMPEGPLELADRIGLDTIYSVMLVFYEEFRDSKYRPHPLFSTMIRAGYYGIKSGKGFYKY